MSWYSSWNSHFLLKLIARIAVTDCRVDLIQICSFPIYTQIHIRLGLPTKYIRIEFLQNDPANTFIQFIIHFVLCLQIHQHNGFAVYIRGVKMAYFLAYYFWLISTTSSGHLHRSTYSLGIAVKILYSYGSFTLIYRYIRVRVVLCRLIDVLHCGQINVHTVIDCAARC